MSTRFLAGGVAADPRHPPRAPGQRSEKPLGPPCGPPRASRVSPLCTVSIMFAAAWPITCHSLRGALRHPRCVCGGGEHRAGPNPQPAPPLTHLAPLTTLTRLTHSSGVDARAGIRHLAPNGSSQPREDQITHSLWSRAGCRAQAERTTAGPDGRGFAGKLPSDPRLRRGYPAPPEGKQ